MLLMILSEILLCTPDSSAIPYENETRREQKQRSTIEQTTEEAYTKGSKS